MKYICFKEIIEYIGLIATTIIIAFLLYAMDTEENKESTRNNLIEERLIQQENYMHQVQADIDNLYERIEQIEFSNKR